MCSMKGVIMRMRHRNLQREYGRWRRGLSQFVSRAYNWSVKRYNMAHKQTFWTDNLRVAGDDITTNVGRARLTE